MADENREDKKGYTFTDKRGLEREDQVDGSQADKMDAMHPDMADHAGTLPPIDFTTLIMSFASAAIVNMGRVPDPMTNAIQKNLLIAQQNIDIIQLLQEKTRGNLNPDEERLMDQVLYELRMSFINAMKEEG